MNNKKTLVVVLNHNFPEYTDRMYSYLKPYERKDYDLVILDNGSKENGKSQYTTVHLPENVFYGGGFRYSVNLVLANEDKYDSLLFTVNTLTLFGYNWVKSMREVMTSKDKVGIVSPSIIAHGTDQNAWPQMHNWGMKTPRKVRWVDFQSPLINIELLKIINPFPDFGIAYGYDVYAGIMAERNNFSSYVLDYVYAVHQKKETVKNNRTNFTLQEFSHKALEDMYKSFNELSLTKELNEMRAWGNKYTPIEL